jgi:hypothetical protein
MEQMQIWLPKACPADAEFYIYALMHIQQMYFYTPD